MTKKEKLENKVVSPDQNLENTPVAPVRAEQASKNSIYNKDGELVVDIYETNTEFVILSAIAGVVIEDIDISVDKDMLIVKGERKNPSKETGKKYFFQECYWGPFSKKIVLPDKIKVEEASAEIDKGILSIRIPKIEKPNVKEKIGIKAA